MHWLVIYDGACGFCRVCVSRLLAWDRRRVLRPLALGTAEADAALHGMTPQARAASWHLVAPDGAVHSGGAAAAPVLRLLPLGRAGAAVADRMPGVMDRAYRFVAAHRRAFGRLAGPRARARADRRIAARA